MHRCDRRLASLQASNCATSVVPLIEAESMSLPARRQRNFLATADRSRGLMHPMSLLQLVIVSKCSDKLVKSFHVPVDRVKVIVDLLNNF